MEAFVVNSRIIKKVVFISSDAQLWIQFHNGQERVYRDVPRHAVEALIAAKSPGQHYLDHIRTQFSRLAA